MVSVTTNQITIIFRSWFIAYKNNKKNITINHCCHQPAAVISEPPGPPGPPSRRDWWNRRGVDHGVAQGWWPPGWLAGPPAPPAPALVKTGFFTTWVYQLDAWWAALATDDCPLSNHMGQTGIYAGYMQDFRSTNSLAIFPSTCGFLLFKRSQTKGMLMCAQVLAESSIAPASSLEADRSLRSCLWTRSSSQALQS